MSGRPRKQPVKVTWFGHSAFRFDTPGGKILLVDPWLDNPLAPAGAKEIERADIILVTHGHADHIGNTVDVARRTGARVFANYEVSLYLKKAGAERVEGMNKSGTVEIEGIRATMVDATHSSGIETDEGMLAGGDPAGFVIRFETGFTAYHAGDTGVFGDMKIIADLYRPDLAILPIGGFFTMGPREAAMACRLLKPRYVMGMHYGTFPILTGTPADLKRLLPAALKPRLRTLKPGGSLSFAR